jgi:hypothetical protein
VRWLAGDAGAAAMAQRTLEDGGSQVPGLDEWAEIGLSAALRRAAPDDQRLAWCTCGPLGGR